MRRNFVNFVLSFLIIILTAGSFSCSDSKKSFLDLSSYLETGSHFKPDTLYATGSSTSKDMQLAIDKAKMAALDSIAYRIKARFGNLQSDLIKDYELEMDSSLTAEFDFIENSIVSFILTGYKTDKKEAKRVNNFYRASVSVEVPMVNIKDVFISEIKKNGELYTLLNVFPAK